jgi:hypothetical protein
MSCKDALYHEIKRLRRHLPDRAARFLTTMIAPDALWLRLPLALVLMVGGLIGFFLPLPAFWMLPLGLALIALDLPFMRSAIARFLAFINGKLDA